MAGFIQRLKYAFTGRMAAQGSLPEEFKSPSWVDRLETIRRWEAGQTTRLNQGHWSGVTGQPINADISAWLSTLANRAEFEIANNPLIEGLVSTYTLSVIGSEGPTLQINTDDEEYNKRRERIWTDWAANAGSNQQLALVDLMRLWIRSFFGRGEFLNQMISVYDAPGPVKMRLLPIHGHRLMTPPEFMGDHEVAMGIRRDLGNRRPLAYYVSQPYIFGAFEVYTGEFLEVPYKDMLHGFLMNEEDQVRGVPWLAPALDTIAEARDFRISTLDACRAAADWGVYLWSSSPDLGAIEIPANSQMPVFERRQQRYVPPGWQPFQVTPQQPPSQWEMLYNAIIREIARCFNAPLMIALLDSSKHNYSSARFDGQMFWRAISYLQGVLGRTLDRIETEVAREAELSYVAGNEEEGLQEKPKGPLNRKWIWPRPPHVDRLKEAQADQYELQNGSISLADVCAANNKAVEDVIAERKRIQDALEKSGLPLIPGIPDGNLQQVGQMGLGNEPIDAEDLPKPEPQTNGSGSLNGSKKPSNNGGGKGVANGKTARRRFFNGFGPGKR